MKKIILFLFLFIGAITTYAQDSLIATHYSDNARKIKILSEARRYYLNKVGPERTEFKITEGTKVILEGYITKCDVVQSHVSKKLNTETRHIIVVDKNDGISEHEYLLTVVYSIPGNIPINFIITTVIKKEAYKAYLGKLLGKT